MIGRAGFSSRYWRVLRWAGLAAAAPALWACTSRTLEAPNVTPTASVGANFQQKINNELDILFMVDNSSSMSEMQQKLYNQLPLFMQVLQTLPNPPSLHVAVVSSDMGANGDSTTAISCTPLGDQGVFQSFPRSNAMLTPPVSCTDTTLATPMGQADSNHTFISNADMMPNYTNPDISKVFQCIALLGDTGCGFENQLASIDRALGGDGQQPSTNANFLRKEAYLGIVILTNEDDCSAPAGTQLYSLNGGQQNVANRLGPIANYRCNQFGHLCTDPGTGTVEAPPLTEPSDVMMTGTTPTFDMTDCTSNDNNGLLTPVSKFIGDIKALKGDHADDQILVASIAAPASPYTIAWLPGSGQAIQPGELWPQLLHSCGAAGDPLVSPHVMQTTTDKSFGDPGVRIAEFVSAFKNSVLASICDPSYDKSMTAIATKLGQLITPPCITGTLQKDAAGLPMCSVIEHLTDSSGSKDIALQNCGTSGANPAQCWTLVTGAMGCAGGSQMKVTDTVNANPASENSDVNCSLCLAGAALPGCLCIAGNPVPGCLCDPANPVPGCV